MRYIYQNVVQDGRGNYVADASVTVTLAGGATKASIYSALTGGTVDADGIITTGADGTFSFYVDEDDYSHSQQFRIVWSKSGFASETWDYIQIFPDGDRTLLTDSTVDQGDSAIVGTLAWHITDLSGSSATITVLSGTHKITTNITSPVTVNLDIKKGGVFKPDATKTLTLYSPEHIIASPRQQIVDMTNNSTDPLIFTAGGTVYPQWWGALGDNSNSDSVPSQAAIESLESVPAARGGIVKFFEGVYLCIAGLTVTESYIDLIGSGRESTIIRRKETSDIGILTTINGSKQLYNNRIKDITFDGVSSANLTGASNGYGLLVYDVAFGEFHNLQFTSHRNSAFLLIGTNSSKSRGHSVKNIIVTDTGDPDDSDANDTTDGPDAIGLIATNSSNFDDLYMYNTGSSGNGLMVFDGSNGNRFNNVFVSTVEGGGIGLDGQNGVLGIADLSRNQFNNVRVQGAQTAGIWLLSNAPATADLGGNIFNNIIVASTTGASGSGDGIRIEINTLGKGQYIQFNNFEVIGNAGYGISNIKGQYCTFTGTGATNTSGMYYESAAENTILDLPGETVTTGSPALQTWGETRINSAGGAITGTLGSGQRIGQIKTIVMTDASTSSTISIAAHQTEDPEVATFDATDETGVFMWTGTEWITIFATCTFV